MNKTVKALALGGVVVASALAGAAIASLTIEPVQLPAEVKYVNVSVPVEVTKEVKVEVPVEKIVTVEKLVDNGKLAAVEQAIYDNSGSVEFVVDGLKDSEVADIADRFVLVNDFKAIAVAEVKKNLADLVDKETVGTVTIDDKDVERVRVHDDADQIVVDSIDFEDKDATLLVTGTFEQDDVKYSYEVSVDIKDGELDDSSLESLEIA